MEAKDSGPDILQARIHSASLIQYVKVSSNIRLTHNFLPPQLSSSSLAFSMQMVCPRR